MNIAGLIVAFVGAVLVALSQLSPLEALSSLKFMRIEGQQETIALRVRFAKIRARLGWILITLGFLLQLMAALFTPAPQISVLPVITV
jgi:hypothetical protein